MFTENCSDILLFDNILSFWSNIIFSCILLFLFEKYDLHAFRNGLESQSILSFSNYCNLAYLFRFCHLNLTISLGFSDLFALFLRHNLIIICFRRFLLKWSLRFPRKFFVFLGACLYKIEIKIFLEAAWVLIADILLQISNLNWFTMILYEIAVNWFFWFILFNFVLRIVCIIWWWSLRPVWEEFAFIIQNFEFVISKSRHEPPSPLKHEFCFIIL